MEKVSTKYVKQDNTSNQIFKRTLLYFLLTLNSYAKLKKMKHVFKQKHCLRSDVYVVPVRMINKFLS